MWNQKNSDNIVYIDIEKRLAIKPSIYASTTKLPFEDESFNTVFFDPPFKWNCDDHPFFSFPNGDLRNSMYPQMAENDSRFVTQYYGIERYKSRSQLVKYLYKAEKELYRVLKPDGCLWLRWCNMDAMNHNQVLGIFVNWHQMCVHEIASSKRYTGETKSFWFMLMKKPLDYTQPDLFSLVNQDTEKKQ